MAGGGQGSNPWAGTAPRGAGGGAYGGTPYGGFPTSPVNSNPWTSTGPRGAGGGPFGGGYRPGGPSVTMPGSVDPRFMTGGLETGGTSPVPTQPNPTLSNPTMSTGFRVDESPGSMNQSFGGVGQQFTGQGGPGNFSSQPAYSGEYFKPGQTLTADQLPAWNKWREAGMPSAPSAAAGGAGAPPTNIYGGPGSGAPYDPTTPGYQPGAGWQTMLRQYAMRDGQSNPNQYVTDRGLSPMWGGQQQPWEPQGFGGSLSQLLQRYRGF
jgi:hypothetical protein